ncbi:unnamed protein product [Nippostrongylus brasiliensis]|uniref:Phosphate transporter n=1 Tax=Nippostrongylus brasiliensis TaxID=27835 RepID=A0A0N4XYW1_NIPBR|nr:unnamed protein product [Nippostrongylus brasiliensis]
MVLLIAVAVLLTKNAQVGVIIMVGAGVMMLSSAAASVTYYSDNYMTRIAPIIGVIALTVLASYGLTQSLVLTDEALELANRVERLKGAPDPEMREHYMELQRVKLLKMTEREPAGVMEVHEEPTAWKAQLGERLEPFARSTLTLDVEDTGRAIRVMVAVALSIGLALEHIATRSGKVNGMSVVLSAFLGKEREMPTTQVTPGDMSYSTHLWSTASWVIAGLMTGTQASLVVACGCCLGILGWALIAMRYSREEGIGEGLRAAASSTLQEAIPSPANAAHLPIVGITLGLCLETSQICSLIKLLLITIESAMNFGYQLSHAP